MKEKITSRLAELKTEYAKGEERLRALEQELSAVKASMLRIGGAMQVLEELKVSTQQNVVEKAKEKSKALKS